jgi:hypothetical protein
LKRSGLWALKIEVIPVWIRAAQEQSAEPSDITDMLSKIELAFAAAHPSSNVRLAAYQATGSFLVKFTSYFAVEIRSSFAEESTATIIAVQSSSHHRLCICIHLQDSCFAVFEGVSQLDLLLFQTPMDL